MDSVIWFAFQRLTSPYNYSHGTLDTIYACQDKSDDIKIGVRSTAVLFGSFIRPVLALFGFTFVATLACTGYANAHGTAFYAVAVGGAAGHVLWQLITVDLNSPQSCRGKRTCLFAICYLRLGC